MDVEKDFLRQIIEKINRAEIRLATIRYDDRPDIPTNPLGSIGEVVREAEDSLEEAKQLIRDKLQIDRPFRYGKFM